MHQKNATYLAITMGLTLSGALPFYAQAALTYENLNGVGLIYDSVENVTWTQDGTLSSDTFDWQDAQSWATNLSLAGVGASGWQLPDANDFTSLYDQLDGTGDKYGAQVFFGPGTNDYASNVSPEYWTSTDGTDFNFYYGYPGSRDDLTNSFPVWAVTSETIPTPEPSTAAFGLLATVLVAGQRKWQRK